MINRTSQIVHLSFDLHVHLVEVPPPVMEPSHRLDALPADVACNQRPDPVLPEPQGFMTNVDPSLKQQILDVS